MTTPYEAITKLLPAIGMPRKTLTDYSQELKVHEMWPRPPRGRPAVKTRTEAFHLANLLLALAAPNSVIGPDAAIDVRMLRFVPANYGDQPYFSGTEFGDVFEALIAFRARTIARGDEVSGDPERTMPHQVNVSYKPSTAELLWFRQDGSLLRREVYGCRADGLNTVSRRLSIGHHVLELAALCCVHQFEIKPEDRMPLEVRAARDEAEFDAFAAKHNAEVRAAWEAELKAAARKRARA
jgi:hypothetical protein